MTVSHLQHACFFLSKMEFARAHWYKVFYSVFICYHFSCFRYEKQFLAFNIQIFIRENLSGGLKKFAFHPWSFYLKGLASMAGIIKLGLSSHVIKGPFKQKKKLLFIARISLHSISRLFFNFKFHFFKSYSIFSVWLGSMLKESRELDFSFSLILAVYRFEHCK